MFILACTIQIGNYTFSRCNNIAIEKSNSIIANTATITIPTTAVLVSNGMRTTVETAQSIQVGMPVTIQLAYKGVYEGIEFKGYVKRINYKIPLEIECEDAIYLIRKKNINKAWKSTTIEQVLNEILSGTGINLAANIPVITMEPFSLKNVDGAFALQKIKDDYGLTIYINEQGELYAGLAYVDNTGTVNYTLNGDYTNVVNADDLLYRSKDDVKLKVKAIAIKGDNSRTEVEVGDDDGALRTLYFYNLQSAAELTKIAQQELDKLKFDGYEGKLKTMLIPLAIPGMKAVIKDDKFPSRAGSYYIESVKTTWGMEGARREVEISIAL